MARSEERDTFLREIGERFQSAFDEAEIRNFKHLALIAENCGYRVPSAVVPSYFAGKTEPSAFVLAGLCKALRVSSDKILFGTDPREEADETIMNFANRAIEMMKEQVNKPPDEFTELKDLFDQAPEYLRKMVLELLRRQKDANETK